MPDNLDEKGFARGGIVEGPILINLTRGDYIVPLDYLRPPKKDDTRDDEEFMEKLLEAMSTPIDPRNIEPTSLSCALRIEIERAESEAAD